MRIPLSGSALALLLWAASASWASAQEACLSCHSGKDMPAAPRVDAARFQKSAHKDLGCAACHAGQDDYPHDPKAGRVSCASCHESSARSAAASDHGRLLLKTKPGAGRKDVRPAGAGGTSDTAGAALCASCHGPAHELRRVKDPASPVNHANIPATCSRCHQKLDFKEKYGLEPFPSYALTVHGRAILEHKNPKAAVCTDCHGGHDLNFSRNSRSRAYKFNIPKTCGRCHGPQLAAYSRSIHAARVSAGVREAPVCTDCHGEHNISARREPGSMVFTGSIVKTCSACHGSERIIAKFGMPLDPARTYRDSYHGVAFVAGNLASANCASCHRYHDVLPSADPASSVNAKNLQKTCGSCHRRAGELLHLGKVHMTFSSTARDIRETVLLLVRKSYILLIVLTIGGMLLHNFLDHKRKLLLGPQPIHDPHELRLSRNERIQHLVLLVSFLGLAYTGFCHTYPESGFAQVAFAGASGAYWRAWLHRAFALAFILLAAYHLYWIAATREGRREIRSMYPRWRDLLDFLQLQRYNLLHRGGPPRFDRFNYIEKSEYWALIWGSGVMIGTGCVVWFRELSLRFLSKWLIDLCLLIHFMEAVLACLAILVWHFYWTVFD
ncbi:MAG: cytochrome c3 family protein, partial [Elusimicrobia bacterium]|nr:cytochrome c3 family protein [Elusimicrobiota bacterium]